MIASVATSILILFLPQTDEGDARLAAHQGSWAVVAMIRDDQATPADILASIRREVDRDHIVWTRDGKNFAGTRFEVDPTTSPPTIDLIPDGGKDRDKRILGIYRLDGDMLTICVADAGQPRPTAFEAKAGSKQTLQSFKRTTPTPKPRSHRP